MARDTTEAGRTAWSFLHYLGTDQHLRFRATWQSEHGSPGLLDVVDDWLVNADGIESCASYEALLIAVTFILEGWLGSTDATNSWDFTLWPEAEDVARWQAGEAINIESGNGIPVLLYNSRIIIDRIARESGRSFDDVELHECIDVWDHQIYDREYFERAQQQYRLRDAEAAQ